ncbi:MAG: hypothetical protein RIR70_481 [Pseudomonadota bacterium]|jgi:polysaccharide chain length determinant protein (PEP-CTERM system associated)
MDDILHNLAANARGMWLNRWLGLFTAWLVGLIGALVVLFMPDKYEASARVYVDTQSVLKPLMSGLAVQPNVEQQIVILSRTLISRPNIERLIRMADMDLSITGAQEREQLIDKLMRTLELRSDGRDNLFTVAYRESNPEQAKRVVQALLSIFVESGLTDKRRDNQSAQKFLDEQIKAYAAKLEEAESRVKAFKLKHMSVGLDLGTRDYFGRMAELTAQLDAARLSLREAEQSRDALRRQIAGEEPVVVPDTAEGLSTIAVPDIDARIDLQKRTLDAMLQRYTEQHPDVVGTRRIIAELEAQKREALQSRKALPPGMAGSAGNPVWQQLRLSLGEVEAEVASLKARVAEYGARINALRQTAQMMPEVESEMMQLLRDHEVHKRNYDALVARRESASLSGNMEATAGVADFRIIDPPAVSPRPVAPNRPMLAAIAAGMALAAGFLVTFVMAQARNVVFDARGLSVATAVPVLGVVTRLKTAQDTRSARRALMGFLLGCVTWFGVWSGLIAMLMLTSRSA